MKVPVSEIVSCNIVRMIIMERKKEIMFNVCVFANIHSVMWADKIQKIDIPYIQVHTGIYIYYNIKG